MAIEFFGGIKLNGSLLILPVVLLIAVYIILGRMTLREVIEQEGRNPYSEGSENSLSSRFSPSMDITKLVFDAAIPRAEYPKSLRAKIRAVRILYAVAPFLLLGTFVAMLMF